MHKRDLFPPLGEAEGRLLALALKAIAHANPLPAKHRAELPESIRSLWRVLTSQRGERREGYLNEPRIRTAYLRYFLPWNLYRLARLLPGLPLELPAGRNVLDLGSGPLTLPMALWIARPELREREFTLFCLDRLPAPMAAGQAALEELAKLAGLPLRWRIVRLKSDLTGQTFENLGLVTAGNVLNELVEHPAWSRLDHAARAAKLAQHFTRQLAPDGRLFLVEPGTEEPAALLSDLRAALLDQGHALAAPCPHAAACPMGGRRGQSWCHFNFSTEGAPPELAELSRQAGLPKEQASLSFLLSARGPAAPAPESAVPAPGGGRWLAARVVSEPFKLPPDGVGRYACSAEGRILLRTTGRWHDFQPGDFLEAELPAKPQTDRKSGAPLIDLG